MVDQHGAPSRGDFLEAAWEVARQYRAFDAYRCSESRASKALQQRCPGFSQQQYLNAFRRAVALYDAATELVAREAESLWAQGETGQMPDFAALVAEVRGRVPGFRVNIYQSALGWVYFWHHLK